MGHGVLYKALDLCYARENMTGHFRKQLPEGVFGSIAPYCCSKCGPIWDPPYEARCGGGRWSPEWIEWRCPHCGNEEFDDYQHYKTAFTVKNRRTIRRNHA